MNDNRGAAVWVIHYTDTDIYAWGYLSTTSQVTNAYRSELTNLYAILELL